MSTNIFFGLLSGPCLRVANMDFGNHELSLTLCRYVPSLKDGPSDKVFSQSEVKELELFLRPEYEKLREKMFTDHEGPAEAICYEYYSHVADETILLDDLNEYEAEFRRIDFLYGIVKISLEEKHGEPVHFFVVDNDLWNSNYVFLKSVVRHENVNLPLEEHSVDGDECPSLESLVENGLVGVKDGLVIPTLKIKALLGDRGRG